MKRKLIPLMALSLFGVVATSCGGSSTWSWEEAKGDKVLKYALLIGQIDHNDSAARTAGIREALGTRPAQHQTNPNKENAVEGKLTLNGVEYKTIEVVSGEQKSTGGATWDQQTATTSTETWLNTHQDIDFFVSNNDGMAEGAIGANNWKEGMPIFGYDSNQSTLDKIESGEIMGTINQNAPAQAAAIYMAARNAIDGKTGNEVFEEGFTKESTNGYGKLTSVGAYSETDHSFLVNNVKVTKENVSEYKTTDIKTLAEKTVKKGTTKTAKIWHSYYSASDTFLTTSMSPLFEHYKSLFNFDVTPVKGDGNDEATGLNALDTAASDTDAFIVNMIKTTNARLYLDKIATKLGATEAAPTSVPVVFWNRQATKENGTVDAEVMADARFKNVFYVGFDAIQGGKLQGQMIVDYLTSLK